MNDLDEKAGAMLRKEYGDLFNQANGLDWASCSRMMVAFHEAIIKELDIDYVLNISATWKAKNAEIAQAQKELDSAINMLRVLNEETVLAGYPGGDRVQTLKNVRQMRQRLAELLKSCLGDTRCY